MGTTLKVLAIMSIGFWIAFVSLIFALIYLPIPLALWNYQLSLILFPGSIISTMFFMFTAFYEHENPEKPVFSFSPQPVNYSGLLKIIGIAIFVIGGFLILGYLIMVVAFVAFLLWDEISSRNIKDRLHQIIVHHRLNPVIPLDTFTTETGLELTKLEAMLQTMVENKEVAGHLDSKGYHP